jgi:hypothetical protein
MNDCEEATPTVVEGRSPMATEGAVRQRSENARTARWIAVGSVLAFMVATAAPADPSAAQLRSPESHDPRVTRGGIKVPGRVVDADTQNPVPGAKITFSRVDLAPVPGSPAPDWVGDTVVMSDAQGQFSLDVPQDQLADHRVGVHVSIRHNDFIALSTQSGLPVTLSSVLMSWQDDEPYHFKTIQLQCGVQYSGQLVDATRKPAGGVRYRWANRFDPRSALQQLALDTIGETDTDGRFRFRANQSNFLQMTFEPEHSATVMRNWNARGGAEETIVPADLGTVALESRPPVRGRALDLAGKPIPGLKVRLNAGARLHQPAITNAAGEFEIPAPLPGVWEVAAESQFPVYGLSSGAVDELLPENVPIVGSARVKCETGKEPEVVELREVRSVTFGVHAVDSRRRPVPGREFSLWGQLANQRKPAPDSPPLQRNSPDFALYSPYNWGSRAATDARGQARFRVPAKLYNATVLASNLETETAYALRVQKQGPWYSFGARQLGDIEHGHEGIELVVYQPAIAFVTIKTDDGNLVLDGRANAISYAGSEANWVNSRLDTPWRGRLYPLLPDREYDLIASASGYFHNTVERRRFDEGSVVEITLVVRKEPKALAPGDLAPVFAVRTLDGVPLAQPDLLGKYVLLHLWQPEHHQEVLQTAGLRRAFDRFGKNANFTMLSLGVANDLDAARKTALEQNLKWPHALLPYRWNDPIWLNYRNQSNTGSVLIGPDGRVIATNLSGDNVVDAVAKALGAK